MEESHTQNFVDLSKVDLGPRLSVETARQYLKGTNGKPMLGHGLNWLELKLSNGTVKVMLQKDELPELLRKIHEHRQRIRR